MQLEVLEHQPAGTARPTPVLFVHGAWHGAWCWEHFLPYFARHGYAAYALSLRGHGASPGREQVRWYSVADYIEDIAQVARELPTTPILVAHSLGGYIVQKYLERHSAPAAVLLASVPASGLLGFGLRFARRHPLAFLKAHLLGYPWYMVETPELMTDLFFSPSLTPQDRARHFARLVPESFRIELEAFALALPRPARVSTPMQVLGAANDRVFSQAEAHATARAYGVEARIFPDMAHDMMLEPGWPEVADHILRWLDQRGL